MSKEFFNKDIPSAVAPSEQTSKLRDSLRSRKGGSGRARPPPPPPPPARSGGTTSSTGGASSYYGKSSSSTAAAPAPPAPAAAQASKSSSYYGSSSTTATAATTGSSSYYSSASTTTTAASAAPAPASSDWYTPPTVANPPAPVVAPQAVQQQQPAASSDWYTPSTTTTTSAFAPAPVQQQQKQPSIMNPYLSQPGASISLEGAMDTSGGKTVAGAATTTGGGGGFSLSGLLSSKSSNPPAAAAPTSSGSSYGYVPYDPLEFENEPPLLEELGINVGHILLKTRAVLLPFTRLAPKGIVENPRDIVQDADLAGPLAFALLLGGELLLTGKIHFGYIYTFGLFGCLSMSLVLNLMSPSDPVSVWTVTSILGYALLPVNLLALVKICMLGYMESLGRAFGIATIAWCTVAATRLLEQGYGMRDQRYLVAYPIALLYSAFVMITIF